MASEEKTPSICLLMNYQMDACFSPFPGKQNPDFAQAPPSGHIGKGKLALGLNELN